MRPYRWWTVAPTCSGVQGASRRLQPTKFLPRQGKAKRCAYASGQGRTLFYQWVFASCSGGKFGLMLGPIQSKCYCYHRTKGGVASVRKNWYNMHKSNPGRRACEGDDLSGALLAPGGGGAGVWFSQPNSVGEIGGKWALLHPAGPGAPHPGGGLHRFGRAG